MCAVGGTPDVSICCSCSAYARMLASCSGEADPLDLRQIETGERRDALDVGACQSVGHARDGSTDEQTCRRRRHLVSGNARARSLARSISISRAVGAFPPGRIDAIIAPHAGIMFSGPVAALRIQDRGSRGRTVRRRACSSGPRTSSPSTASRSIRPAPSSARLVPRSIDESLGAELLAASSVVQPLPVRPSAANTRSRCSCRSSSALLPDLPIVPLLIGYQTRDTIEQLAEALGRMADAEPPPACCQQRSVALLRRATAMSLDQRVRDCVADFDADRLLELFEQYPEGERGRYVACGGGAIIAVMLAAERAARDGARVLRYAHSGEVSGDNEGVVGYLAGACGVFFDVH